MTDRVTGVNPYQRTKDIKASVDADKKTVPTSEVGKKDKSSEKAAGKQEKAESVVYDKSKPYEGLKTYNKKGKALDPKTIEAMKSEAEAHYARMIDTVRQMIAKQSEKNGGISKGLEDLMKLPLNPAGDSIASLESGKDIDSPDNFWSAEATATRIVDFAKQISGGDTAKYDLLKGAIEKGFKQAASYFEKMPDITSKTHDLVMKGLDEWAGKTEKASGEGKE